MVKKIIVYIDDEGRSIKAFHNAFCQMMSKNNSAFDLEFIYFYCLFNKNSDSIEELKRCTIKNEEQIYYENLAIYVDSYEKPFDELIKGVIGDAPQENIIFVIDIGMKGPLVPVDKNSGVKLLKQLKESSTFKESRYIFLSKNGAILSQELKDEINKLNIKRIKKPEITDEGKFREDREGVVSDALIEGEIDKEIGNVIDSILSKMNECDIMIGLILWELFRK